MAPRWLDIARTQIGVKEWPGSATNPTVSSYYRDAVGKGMADSVPWCMAFVNAMLERSGHRGTRSLLARSALTWGQKLNRPVPGAIVVFSRGAPPSGHVAFYVGDAGNNILVLGGNQNDEVNIGARPKSRVLGYRWPTGVPLPYSLKHKESAMSDMTPQQIMDAMSKIYSRIDRWGMGDLAEIKQAVKKSVECMFYLAKMQVPDSPKALAKSLAKPKPKRKRK
jgi:uncharacterized protein (TIGR02594 family)